MSLEAMGISRQCAHRWVARFDTEGEAGLHDRSSRPHAIADADQRRGRGSRCSRLGVSIDGARTGSAPSWASRPGPCRGSCAATMCRACAICDPLTGEVIRASKTTAVRYERDRPGELVHMDVKKIGRIPDGGGWRAHGRHDGQPARHARRPEIGYDYVHSVVDDHCRLAYSEILADEKGGNDHGVLARAAAHFADPRHHRIEARHDRQRLELHAQQQTSLSSSLATSVKQMFIRPHCPWQNGKVERFNRTLQSEWAYRQVVHHERGARRRSCAMARALQQSTTPLRSRRPTSDQPTCHQRDGRVQLRTRLPRQLLVVYATIAAASQGRPGRGIDGALDSGQSA